MVVNVNPFDTGFDENSHVMKFAAVAKNVATWRRIHPKIDLHGISGSGIEKNMLHNIILIELFNLNNLLYAAKRLRTQSYDKQTQLQQQQQQQQQQHQQPKLKGK